METTVRAFGHPVLPYIALISDLTPIAMAIRALIVDDEADARNNLRLMLEEHCPQVEVVGMAASADEAQELIGSNNPKPCSWTSRCPARMAFPCSVPS